MKKALPIILAVIAVVAVIFGIVANVNGGNAKKDLEAQVATLKSQAETAAATAAEELSASKSKVDELTAQVEDLTKQAEEAATASAAAVEKAAADAKTEAASALESAQTEAADAKAKVEELTTQVTDLTTQVTDLTAQAEAAKETAAALETAKTEAADAKAKVEELTAQVADLTAQAETAKTEAAAALETAKTEAAAALKTAQDEAAAAQSKVEELTKALAKAERAVIAAKSNAYIMYANTDWSIQNWGTADSEDGIVTVNPAEAGAPGDYTVSLEFAKPAEGLAFAAVGINNAEKLYPNYYIDIKEIRVNGEKIEIKKGYTSSDDGVVTRMNIYNEWVTELPADARRLDGDLTDASPIMVDASAFASVSKVEVDFYFGPAKAYLMYADAAWAQQNWGFESTDTMKVTTADITGEGEYKVGLEFTEPAEGLAFTALGIKNGEKDFPNWVFDVTGVEVNGQAVELGKDYTSSDDGKETRSNIYNEWVAELPPDARSVDDVAECTPKAVDPAVFTGVKSVVVTFNAIRREPAAAAAAPAEAAMTKEEADALKAEGFKAYIGVQGKDTYVFRNAWNDTYGLNDTENPFFNRLTGWDAENKAEDYGGTFVDADIKGDGDYSVSLTTGEKGFGTTASFNLLFVSTNIPSKLYDAGYLKIDNVKTAIGSAAAKEYSEIDTSGDYVMIKVLDSYNQTAEPFGYTVPGAGESITVAFTVSNW